MGRRRRFLGALVVTLCGLVGPAGVAAPPAAAAPPDDPWVVDRPRFEPLDGSPLLVAGIGEYRGSVELSRTGGGLAVINAVGLDDYLRGISEVPVSWPLEAQKAQAIAARTYALHELRRPVNAAYKAAGADICATDACQVYAGLAKERRAGSANWNAAVAQTRGQVVLFKGAPIVAKYSSSNGGRTVAGGQPYLQPTDDPDDRYSPLHRWTASYPLVDVVRVVGFSAATTEIHREGDVVVAGAVDAEGGVSEQRMPAAEFRSRIIRGFASPPGLPQALPSARFDAGTADGLVHINGRGWGHGIGLSQYGALGKAARGMKAPDILAAYYGGLRPVELPADKLPAQVRVALDLDRAEAVVSNASGHFRVVAADGTVLAHRASGSWMVAPAPGGRVKLVPPADQAGPPAASLAALDPAVPTPARKLSLRLELTGPAALTRLAVVRPDGSTTELDPRKLRPSGPVTVRLSGGTTRTAGTYHLQVDRDAGAGRVVTTTLPFDVVAPVDPAGSRRGDGEAPPPDTALVSQTSVGHLEADPRAAVALQTLATALLIAVVVVGGFWVGRRPGLPLH